MRFSLFSLSDAVRVTANFANVMIDLIWQKALPGQPLLDEMLVVQTCLMLSASPHRGHVRREKRVPWWFTPLRATVWVWCRRYTPRSVRGLRGSDSPGTAAHGGVCQSAWRKHPGSGPGPLDRFAPLRETRSSAGPRATKSSTRRFAAHRLERNRCDRPRTNPWLAGRRVNLCGIPRRL